MLHNLLFQLETPKEGIFAVTKIVEPRKSCKVQPFLRHIVQMSQSGCQYQKEVFILPFKILSPFQGELPCSETILVMNFKIQRKHIKMCHRNILWVVTWMIDSVPRCRTVFLLTCTLEDRLILNFVLLLWEVTVKLRLVL